MKDNLMPVAQFEQIYATAVNLIRSSSSLFELTEEMKTLDDDMYYTVIKLHNASCDFIEAYRNLSKEEN